IERHGLPSEPLYFFACCWTSRTRYLYLTAARLKESLLPYFGTTGRRRYEAMSSWWNIVCCAGTPFFPSPNGSPVLRFRSKRGKLLELISSRIRCPGRKTLLVAHKSMVNRYGFPDSISFGALADSR